MIEYTKECRVFNFGKYKGETINKIIRENPDYINWLRKNIKDFKLTKDELNLLNNKKKSNENKINKLIEKDKFLMEP